MRALNVALANLHPDRLWWVPAIDGTARFPDRPWRGSPQSWGCAESHVLALCGVRGQTLIVEDDISVPADFPARFTGFASAVPEDWEVLMLGGEHLSPPVRLNPDVVRCRRTCRTHAYLVRDSAVATRLIALIAASDWHWDLELGLAMFARELVAYAPARFLVEVTGSPSSIPDSVEFGTASPQTD